MGCLYLSTQFMQIPSTEPPTLHLLADGCCGSEWMVGWSAAVVVEKHIILTAPSLVCNRLIDSATGLFLVLSSIGHKCLLASQSSKPQPSRRLCRVHWTRSEIMRLSVLVVVIVQFLSAEHIV